jgi:hypothetical protein
MLPPPGKPSPDRPLGPVRTCLGCGGRFPQQELLRFIAEQDCLVEADRKKFSPGRGVYCCANHRCLSGFMRKRGRLLKALRVTKIDCSSIFRLVDEYRLNITDCSN